MQAGLKFPPKLDSDPESRYPRLQNGNLIEFWTTSIKALHPVISLVIRNRYYIYNHFFIAALCLRLARITIKNTNRETEYFHDWNFIVRASLSIEVSVLITIRQTQPPTPRLISN